MPHTSTDRPATSGTPAPGSRLRSRSRLWCFRLSAVVLGLSVFPLLELLCWTMDWGRPDDAEDPFVGFSEIRPLFVLDRDGESGPPGTRYHIPSGRRAFFARASFPATKTPKTFRIFCLGGSTVQGRPFSTETSFTTWLRLALEAADSSRRWEVINCGGISYASYRLVPILQECLAYQPDLFVICTGHNEFLEDRTYGTIKDRPAIVVTAAEWFARTRSYTLYRSAVLAMTGKAAVAPARRRTVLKAEVDAQLDYRGGLEAYHRDDARRDAVVNHFETNLWRMIHIARRAHVPVILVQPTSNLCDCPPFKSQHRRGLTDADREEWNGALGNARALYPTDLNAAVAQLQHALSLDPRYAATYYELGQCFETLHQLDEARVAFVRARDEDICPLRMIAPLERAMQRVADETRTPMLNAHRLLEEQCPSGILGDFLLVDHIHPSFQGHQMIATALCQLMAQQDWVQLPAGWPARREAAYTKHFASLDRLYFLRGERTLESLRGWAAGRAPGPPFSQR